MTVRLREITAATVDAVCALDAGDGGAQVAPNARSIAQAHFEPAAWFRAVHADTPQAPDALVGFALLYDPTRAVPAAAPLPPADLWRLMIDRRHQGAGYGSAAVRLLIAHARSLPGVPALRVSHVAGVERLARFYRALGFVHTGEVDDGERVMTLDLR